MSEPILIVGGGPAGLSAAHAAASAGRKVILVEKEDRLGGAPILSSATAGGATAPPVTLTRSSAMPRSRIDGSVQPYGLTIPASYDGSKPMRLDVWLHGTQQQNNEVRFIAQQSAPHETSQILAEDFIQVEPFARLVESVPGAGGVEPGARARPRTGSSA